MTNETLFNLTEELQQRIEIAKQNAKRLEVKSGDIHFPFVHIGDKEYINPKYLPFEYQLQIIQLGEFLREHCEIKQEDLNKILTRCKTRFAVLVDVNRVVENLVKEFRLNKDEKHVPYLYFGLKQNKENNINV